ncbi:M3 family oligoendopeptidase [Acetobacteraceae bacterium KSS8]|uniref:M3 family oligoendopeptidase n=1 Tax=Endosaccharibacter trunci TaxID=2812733 RepID=A0ABT1W2W7_9PROT|nr:M3 family oligoendopeptidase [Acetobacteraceae bacterium KSS8]
MTHMPRFAEIHAETPTREGIETRYRALDALLDQNDLAQALREWDQERRRYESWAALVHLAFSRDTTSEKAKADRDYADTLSPLVSRFETAMRRRLLAWPDRQAVESIVGAHVLRLWEGDIATFDPAIEADLEEEAKLCARYTELLASARVTVAGTTTNLSGLAPFAESLDRDLRHEAARAQWGFFAANAEELDSLYDRLVRLRHGMALKLGYDSYTPLAYKKMRRVDYGPEDVARFREEVVRHVVPLVGRLLEKRRAAQGWDRLHSWDENLIDPQGNPKPIGDHDVLVDRAQTMFDRMDARMGGFYRAMREGGFMDLRNREGKAGGGFCTSFPTAGMPFIFANFNGTHGDINVFTHEMGHAFQNWMSRDLPGVDVLWPTMEAAEINSMALEFLTYPQMALMVGEDAADRFRRMHMIGSLAFFPYGVCVDHFQHEVYARPEMTPAERNATWKRLEAIYLPWRDYGDLAHPAGGGRWQSQLHIYRLPFYYIDYALAQCCAMQFWIADETDREDAMRRYVDLAALGGSAPFTELVRSAGLVSPFEPGALEAVVRHAEAMLG